MVVTELHLGKVREQMDPSARPSQRRNMERKTAEQVHFTVKAPAERRNSRADHPEKHVLAVRQGCVCTGPKSPGGIGASTDTTKMILHYKNATQHLAASGLKVSAISKAGVGMIKTVTGYWRQPEKKTRSTSAGNRHEPSDNFLCKRHPFDALAALVLRGQAGQNPLQHEAMQVKLRPAKPQNCRRIVVLGAPRTGKTSILRRFLRDGFTEQYESTSEDFYRKLYQIRGQNYQIDILDASGERGFPAKRRLSILTGDLFLLVCSVDNRSSFEEVRALRKEIVAAKTKLLKHKSSTRVPVVICVNKVDLDQKDRNISQAEIRQVLGYDSIFFETSAKDCTNLEEMFRALAKSGGLPKETLPSMHRKISIRSYQALRSERRGARGKRVHELDAPFGALCPLARRPSISTDLRNVLGSSATRKPNKPLERCQFQWKNQEGHAFVHNK